MDSKNKPFQLNIRISPELHKKAKLMAVQTGRPLADIIAELLEDWIKRQEDKPPLPY